MRFAPFIFFISFFISSQTFAQVYYDSIYRKPRYFSVDVQWQNYNDVLNDPENPQATLGSTYNINLNTRFYRTYNLVLCHGKAFDDSWSFFGMGFRIDLPGIFFFGGRPSDFVRRAKREDINTYLQVTKMKVTRTGVDDFVDDKVGFGMDVFLTDSFYVNLELDMISHQGNQFVASVVGVGYEF